MPLHSSAPQDFPVRLLPPTFLPWFSLSSSLLPLFFLLILSELFFQSSLRLILRSITHFFSVIHIFINLFPFIHKIFTTSTRFSHISRIYYNHKIINTNYFITFLFHMSMKIDTPSFKNKIKTCWPEFPRSGQHVFILLFLFGTSEHICKFCKFFQGKGFPSHRRRKSTFCDRSLYRLFFKRQSLIILQPIRQGLSSLVKRSTNDLKQQLLIFHLHRCLCMAG